jgi:hypothetical protein
MFFLEVEKFIDNSSLSTRRQNIDTTILHKVVWKYSDFIALPKEVRKYSALFALQHHHQYNNYNHMLLPKPKLDTCRAKRKLAASELHDRSKTNTAMTATTPTVRRK